LNIQNSKQILIDDIVLKSRQKIREERKDESNILKKSTKDLSISDYSLSIESKIQQNKLISDDLLGLISNRIETGEQTKNKWGDELEVDEFYSKAKDLLNYDNNQLRSALIMKAEDPLLQAHSSLCIKPKSRYLPSQIMFKVQSRYLKHRGGKFLVYNDTSVKPAKKSNAAKKYKEQTKKSSILTTSDVCFV
jgi:hypothetical protein